MALYALWSVHHSLERFRFLLFITLLHSAGHSRNAIERLLGARNGQHLDQRCRCSENADVITKRRTTPSGVDKNSGHAVAWHNPKVG